MSSDSPKPWFVGKGVRLGRRHDFCPAGAPFKAFAVDFRDGMIEVIGLDAPGDSGRLSAEFPEAGNRCWVPVMMLGGIAAVSESELAQWKDEANYFIPEIQGDKADA
jgi:hypothetical protein